MVKHLEWFDVDTKLVGLENAQRLLTLFLDKYGVVPKNILEEDSERSFAYQEMILIFSLVMGITDDCLMMGN